MTKNDLTVIYYTCNYLEKANPFFLRNTKRQLVKAVGDLPIIAVSHKPMKQPKGHTGKYTNLVAGRDYKPYRTGRHHLNIYHQIMIGCQHAKTKYVAMAEDDILYSESHFRSPQIKAHFDGNGDVFLYDMNKVSLFTWTKPPIFSYRSKRMVVNQLLAPAKMLAESLEERFKRLENLLAMGKPEESILRIWGDPGRYHKHLGVPERTMIPFYCQSPSIVFTHSKAYGYEFNHGKKKAHGDIKIVELYEWGRAEDVLKLWGTVAKE